ncbi:MAG: hypothetical protein IPG31_01710 [Nitrosomonas sp.]|nr:hypothetical protein [Nitrosomonas sp.]
MAAAFAALHRHGHLIGDVNQKNFLFGRNSKVVLVDCDSYQINAKGVHYQCEVCLASIILAALTTIMMAG